MASFNPWDVVKVPFPYTDRPVRQYRPVLVVAAGSIQASHGLLWILMIASAENRRWADDCPRG
jgi:mRNA interferase MazF